MKVFFSKRGRFSSNLYRLFIAHVASYPSCSYILRFITLPSEAVQGSNAVAFVSVFFIRLAAFRLPCQLFVIVFKVSLCVFGAVRQAGGLSPVRLYFPIWLSEMGWG